VRDWRIAYQNIVMLIALVRAKYESCMRSHDRASGTLCWSKQAVGLGNMDFEGPVDDYGRECRVSSVAKVLHDWGHRFRTTFSNRTFFRAAIMNDMEQFTHGAYGWTRPTSKL
jgi:hypothetical protein